MVSICTPILPYYPFLGWKIIYFWCKNACKLDSMCRSYEHGNDKKIKWKLNLEISHEIDFDQRKLICFVYVAFVVAVDEHKKNKLKGDISWPFQILLETKKTNSKILKSRPQDLQDQRFSIKISNQNRMTVDFQNVVISESRTSNIHYIQNWLTFAIFVWSYFYQWISCFVFVTNYVITIVRKG